jgi:parallel beta-helix repeat protein
MPNAGSVSVRAIFILLLACPVSAAVWAKTINVPGDAATIQAGINLASNGDTVLVAPGTYIENIDFNGKNITVTSSGGAAQTIINGNAVGVVVTFENGEGRGAVINGFTIQGPVPTDDSVQGGYDGVYVSEANPTITNNIITENRGFGIEVSFGSAFISGNTVTYTKTEGAPAGDYGCDYDDGDGIYIGGGSSSITAPPVIDHNTIEYNVGHCEGGGIGLYAAPDTTVISNNIIANNQSLGYGGGVYVVNTSASLIQNLIYNNTSGVAGGGAYLSGPGGSNGAVGPVEVFLTNNTIYGNTIQLNRDVEDAWVDGSQVALPNAASQIGFFNDLIIANDSYSAISCWPIYSYLSGAPPVVVNSDVLNTGGAAYGGWCTTPAGGMGNIAADPKFNDPSTGDFHLQAGSLAIDTGFNAAPGILTTDISGNPRVQNASGASEPVVDMGVYEAAGAPESRLASETALSALPANVFYGQTVNLSTTVTDSSSEAVSPGTVNVLDDWSAIQQESLNSSGVATGSTSSLAVGSHWLVASFGGNTGYRASVSTPAEVTVNGFSTSTTLTFSASPVNYGQPETLTANVTLGTGNPAGTGTATGSVQFYGAIPAEALLATVPLSANGTASYTTSSLPSGSAYLQAIYEPTGGFLGSESQNLQLLVIAPAVATVEVYPSLSTITTSQPLTITVQLSGTNGNPNPTGTVTLTCGSYTSQAVALSSETATINVPAGALPVGADVLTVHYSGDSVYGAATGVGDVSVVAPSFSIQGSAVSVTPGANGTSTITVTPQNGFTGSVTLTAAVTSSPTGAANLPNPSFGSTTPVSITGATAGTATLTITTSAGGGCTQLVTMRHEDRWLRYGGLTLACMVFWGGRKRRRWQSWWAMLFLLLGLTAGVMACGGGSGGGGGTTCTVVAPPTTAGNYTVTITGTSGTLTETNTVSLTVQ